MKNGLVDQQGMPDLAALVHKAKACKESAQDYVGSTELLFMKSDGSIEIDTGAAGGDAHTAEILPAFETTNHARRQICTWAKIPAQYADRCPSELLAINANHWFKNGVDSDKGPPARMLRTMMPNELLNITRPVARAFVSDKFNRFDNWDYVNAVFPVLEEYRGQGLNIDSCNIDEHTLNLKGHIEGIEETILRPGTALGEGHNTYFVAKPGFSMRNGETGKSVIGFEPGTYDSGCTNLAIYRSESMKRYHLGASQADGELWGLLSDETQKASNEALAMQIRDYARASLDGAGEVFQRTCNLLREKLGIEVKRPEATMKLVAQEWGLTESETAGCVEALLTRGDMSVFGVQAAITQYSQESDVSYERATDLEAIGGEVLEWSANRWDNLLEQAAKQKVAA